MKKVTLNLESLRDQIYQFLRHEMQAGELLPGSRVDMKELCQQLGVSVTPIRDALVQLQAEGFVSIAPRRWVRINALSLKDIDNLYEVIGALEASAIKSVFHKLDKAAVRSLEQFNDEYRQAIFQGDTERIYRKNLSFHEVFLDLSENHHLKKIIRLFKERLYDFPRRAYLQEWELRNSDEHQQLIDCIKKGDSDASVRVMKDVHWSFRVQENYIRKFYSLAMEELDHFRQERRRP